MRKKETKNYSRLDLKGEKKSFEFIFEKFILVFVIEEFLELFTIVPEGISGGKVKSVELVENINALRE